MSNQRVPFGRLLTAMITPLTADDALNLEEAARLAKHLVDEQLNDALVINGTTGESPTTTDAEKSALLEAVLAEVGDRAQVVAGVGTFSTAHTIELAKQAKAVGAHGLLVVTPYYSRPPQDALVAHFLRVADATDLPIMVYDIPHRAGVPVDTASLIELAEHPNIVAVKDAKGLPVASSQVLAASTLAYYAGDDAMTLPLMAVGGSGLVGTSSHFTGRVLKPMIEAFAAGDLASALETYRKVLPVLTGVFATQGCMLVKAGLNARGFNVGHVRAPLLDASPAQQRTFVEIVETWDSR